MEEMEQSNKEEEPESSIAEENNTNTNKRIDANAGVDVEKIKAEVIDTVITQKLYLDLLDPSKPWILVPNGSLNGYFDEYVPEKFRIGPWTTFSKLFCSWGLYITALYTIDIYQHYDTLAPYRQDVYYDKYSIQWYWNLFGFCWTLIVVRNIMCEGWGWLSFLTYTSESYAFIVVRYALSTLVPFFPRLSLWNEFFRFPMLLQALATFCIWNFGLMPVMYVKNMKSPEDRQKFVAYFTNFRLVQLHVFNLFFAVMNGIWGTPLRPMDALDRYAMVLCTAPYALFYVLILDRLGIHLYYPFSPRTNLTMLTWTIPFALILGCFDLWKGIIETYGDDGPLEYCAELLQWNNITTTLSSVQTEL